MHKERANLPLYLDRHYTEGVSEEDIVEAHQLDLDVQQKYDASFLTYWFDEGRQTTFCLVSAPSADTITEIHSKTHGQIPNDVVEVDQTDVLTFMGRIADIPSPTKPNRHAFDRATRTIMFTDLVGYTSMMSRLGDDRAFKLLRQHNTVVRDALTKFGGREIKHTGDGVMASFDVADQAVRAGIQMSKQIAALEIPDIDERLSIRIGMTSGEPLEENGDLFGSVVNLASRLCDFADSGEILLSDKCEAELSDASIKLESIGAVTIRGFDEPVVVSKIAD
jgi:class 3 adenylate cyclase